MIAILSISFKIALSEILNENIITFTNENIFENVGCGFDHVLFSQQIVAW